MTSAWLVSFICGAMATLLASQALAFQLSPEGTQAERRFAKRWGTTIRAQIFLAEAGLHNFADPVHEALTQRTFDCDGDWSDCADPDLENAGPYVIAGIRWNDDPVFKLSAGEAEGLPCTTRDTISFVTQTACWLGLFRDAESKSARDPHYFLKRGRGTLMSRSHFGDLQFLHAMASSDEELAGETRKRMLMWAEFTWGVIHGTYRLDTNLRDIAIPGWQEHFNNGQTVQDLFTLGRPWLRPHVREVAFGSLLHMVQDSFAQGHANRREPLSGQTCLNGTQVTFGRIEQFHSYAKQDHSLHKQADSSASARKHIQLNSPDVLDAGKALRGYKDRNEPWSRVRPLLEECLFSVADEGLPANAGDGFHK